MLIILVSFAFGFGLLLGRLGLPPMVGFLIAGFAYSFAGLTYPAGLDYMADIGIKLLLFSIGLKLDLKGLFKPEIWASATMHIILSSAFITGSLMLGKYYFTTSLLDVPWQTLLILGFALSFSSTVFAVKVLEEKGDMAAFYGRIAIGILIMQDIFAVIFLSVAEGKIPSYWAFAVFLLPLLRPLLFKIMDLAGHGEMLMLYGLFLCLGVGGEGFGYAGLKPDLGALVIGVLVAKHHKSSELSKSLLNLKDLLLVGFFLSIGMKGQPTVEILVASAILCLLLPFKSSLYYLIIKRFGILARTNLKGTLALTNFSEFGLIVAALASAQGLINPEWLLVIALTISISFVLSSPLNEYSESIYSRFGAFLNRFNPEKVHPNEAPIDFSSAKVLIFGMGRIGTGAYDELQRTYDKNIYGVEHAPERVLYNKSKGRNSLIGDATDIGFWNKVKNNPGLELVILAMPNHSGNLFAAMQIKKMGISCPVAAIARYTDEVDELNNLGIKAYNMYQNAGTDLARKALELFKAAEEDKQPGE